MNLIKTISDKVFSKPHGIQLTEDQVKNALSTIMDPDLGRDIVSLGFVRNIKVTDKIISVEINLTTPACPVKESLKSEAETNLKKLGDHLDIQVTMTATTRGRVAAADAPISASLGQVKNIIAVASGKGGVGKSTTSVNLAYALAASGSKVGLLDADVYGPSIPFMTRPDAPTQSNSNLMVPPMASGVKVMSIGLFAGGDKATIVRGPMASGVIKQFLTQVQWGELDYLIIDYPPGTGDIQLTLSQTAPITGAVVVTTPQDVALIDVRKAIAMFDTMKVPILGVVETMSYFICDGCDKKHEIFRSGGGAKVSKEFGLNFLGAIPLEPSVASASDRGIPAVMANNDSPASLAYKVVAGSVAQQVSLIHEAYKDALGFFSFEWKKSPLSNSGGPSA
jgi:ATP-binding protein involved in chromosome partitioning